MRRVPGKPKSRLRRKDAGVALLLVLMFVVLLAVLVVEFAFDARVDATVSAASSDDMRAIMAGKSGIAAAKGVLAADLIVNEDEADASGFTEVYDSLDEIWADGIPPLTLNDADVDLIVVDEYGKINLNALYFDDGASGEAEREELVSALRYLFTRSLRLENDPTDALLEWLDSDDNPSRPLGYENGYYEALDPPYRAKNGPMDALEELLLIPGFTYELFEGNTERGVPPLDDLLTVHGDPQGRVNINTASYSVLEALFAVYQDQGGVSPRNALNELGQHDDLEGPFRTEKEVLEWLRENGVIAPPPPPPEPGDDTEPVPEAGEPELFEKNLFTVASSVFRVDCDVTTADAEMRVRTYLWRDTGRLSKMTAGGGADALAAQLFRILDWRIIR